ncbi:RagB/SusD family nutrient uptake outer membrane protein [Pedobacter sp. AW31-3R]|uniref:RagB/SusD family nutrient uptake outer membrane protein n=1 Tax=Pedobacter sp. AW31-3R TaxID=3445781 RepID=UPI003FA04A6B
MKTKNISNKGLQKVMLFSFLGLLLFTASCKKFTELKPQDKLDESTAFSTKATIELAMNGVYQQAGVGTYDAGTGAGAGRGYPFGAAATEQAEMRGEDMVNLQQFYAITYTATYSTSSANNVNHWNNLYALINQANIVIAGVKTAAANGILTAEEANSYEGESRFLRALAHHELLLHFAKPYADANGSLPGVPYRLTAVNNAAELDNPISLGRGTVAEDYVNLLADLDFAEANLGATSTNFSRATKGAAIALKTRIQLHKGDWAAVIAEGTKLGANLTGTIASPIGAYTLTASPVDPFTNYSANSESIFSIANSAASNPGVNGGLSSMFLPSNLGGRSLVATSPNLYNASFWVAGDLRKSLLQVSNGAGIYFNNKFTDPTTNATWTPIIRYAEVLLNVAEADARSGNNAQAFVLLNAVRNRSVPAAARYTSAPADLLLAILNERRVEFAGEGKRWPDLHRLALDATYGKGGIPAKLNVGQVNSGTVYDGVTQVTPAREAIPYTNFRFLWPFPLSEVNSNPTLAAQQNPGYGGTGQ